MTLDILLKDSPPLIIKWGGGGGEQHLFHAAVERIK